MSTRDHFILMGEYNQWMNSNLYDFASTLSTTDMAEENTKGQSFVKNFGLLVYHFFNHQTHHRGQVTTLLSQANLDCGTTDLLAKIPNTA